MNTGTSTGFGLIHVLAARQRLLREKYVFQLLPENRWHELGPNFRGIIRGGSKRAKVAFQRPAKHAVFNCCFQMKEIEWGNFFPFQTKVFHNT